MDDSQITGATSSYARKYALNGLFCIDDNKDADDDSILNAAINEMNAAKDIAEAKVIWSKHKHFQTNKSFKEAKEQAVIKLK